MDAMPVLSSNIPRAPPRTDRCRLHDVVCSLMRRDVLELEQGHAGCRGSIVSHKNRAGKKRFQCGESNPDQLGENQLY